MKDYIMIGDKKILIDSEDHDQVSKHQWHLQTGRNMVRCKRLGTSLHKFVLGIKENTAYHINGNTWNNRKDNLEECSNGAAAAYMREFRDNLETATYANDHIWRPKNPVQWEQRKYPKITFM